jgi:hypothetical protein
MMMNPLHESSATAANAKLLSLVVRVYILHIVQGKVCIVRVSPSLVQDSDKR